MKEPMSLEEFAGEVPRPTLRPPLPADSWVHLRQQSAGLLGEPGVGYYTYGTMPKTILFNDSEFIDDPDLKGFVKWGEGHDDHFHVQLQ